MANKWGIPKVVEDLILLRDKSCVYCNVVFFKDDNSRKKQQSWEHIVNDIRINVADNIALCCISCNASKGSKSLEIWLESKYCKSKQITKDTVAMVVKEAMKNRLNLK